MPHVTRRADSSRSQYSRRVPVHVREKLRGTTLDVWFPPDEGPESPFKVPVTFGNVVKFSLRTSDKRLVDARRLTAETQISKRFAAAQVGSVSLSHKDLVALAGVVYRWHIEAHEQDPGPPDRWAAYKAFTRAVVEGRLPNPPPVQIDDVDERQVARASFGENLTAGVNALPQLDRTDRMRLEALEQRFGGLATRVLTENGFELTAVDRAKLLEHIASASLDAGWRLKENALGDYSPDRRAERFPPFDPASVGRIEQTSLMNLFEGWWAEAKAAGRKPSTYESYRSTLANLIAFLKSGDARAVTAEKVVAFKNHRLASKNPKTGKPLSAKTVKDSDLAALKTVFGWAVSNRKLPSNPAKDITIKLGRKRRERQAGFTDEEVLAILTHSVSHVPGPGELEKTTAAKKWVSWLCAYTGSRVGEMAQLRKEDVRQVGDNWVVHVTPEAGRIKTDQARDIVMHPHLVELGFPGFVSRSDDGPLFLRPGKDGDVLGPLDGLCNRLREWVREVVPDRRVAPHHGWRHRFVTVWREAGLDPRIRMEIQGRIAVTVDDGYGDVSFKAQAAALAKVPRFKLSKPSSPLGLLPVKPSAPTADSDKPKRRGQKRSEESRPEQDAPV